MINELSFSKVWTFGCNDEGSLGRPIEEEEDSFLPGEVTIISLINMHTNITLGDPAKQGSDDLLW